MNSLPPPHSSAATASTSTSPSIDGFNLDMRMGYSNAISAPSDVGNVNGMGMGASVGREEDPLILYTDQSASQHFDFGFSDVSAPSNSVDDGHDDSIKHHSGVGYYHQPIQLQPHPQSHSPLPQVQHINEIHQPQPLPQQSNLINPSLALRRPTFDERDPDNNNLTLTPLDMENLIGNLPSASSPLGSASLSAPRSPASELDLVATPTSEYDQWENSSQHSGVAYHSGAGAPAGDMWSYRQGDHLGLPPSAGAGVSAGGAAFHTDSASLFPPPAGSPTGSGASLSRRSSVSRSRSSSKSNVGVGSGIHPHHHPQQHAATLPQDFLSPMANLSGMGMDIGNMAMGNMGMTVNPMDMNMNMVNFGMGGAGPSGGANLRRVKSDSVSGGGTGGVTRRPRARSRADDPVGGHGLFPSGASHSPSESNATDTTQDPDDKRRQIEKKSRDKRSGALERLKAALSEMTGMSYLERNQSEVFDSATSLLRQLKAQNQELQARLDAYLQAAAINSGAGISHLHHHPHGGLAG